MVINVFTELVLIAIIVIWTIVCNLGYERPLVRASNQPEYAIRSIGTDRSELADGLRGVRS